ncbi:SNF2 family N-terminal domain-containing protein [Amylocystis lapponica]|nr:SNF2 family N-terminal domain-containing protein [Amylocystis lapponica]
MSPFEALDNFLPAGTLKFLLSGDSCLKAWKPRIASDGWYFFPGHGILNDFIVDENTSDEDHDASDLVLLLDVLIEHHFIAATCFIGLPGHTLYVRVYLIPFDLANVQGQLRMRDETSVLSPSRPRLKLLLSRICQGSQKWEGQPSTKRQSLLAETVDNRSMIDLYAALPSPVGVPEYFLREVPGMRSILYTYQARTVSAMMAREVRKDTVPDPVYIPIKGIDGGIFHLQPTTMEILRECPRVEQARGGILCEELGTGKTVMMLALILATLDHLPEPEENPFDYRPVMTPLSFRYFPTADCETARRRIAQGNKMKKYKGPASSSRIPSLVEILLHQCRVQPAKLQLRTFQEPLEQHGLWKYLKFNTPFYHHFDVQQETSRPRRGQVDVGPKVMYLSAATLIIVPPNLLAQWVSEITKHCHDILRILEVRKDTPLPHPSDIASQYDIVLMTYARFNHEEKYINTSRLFSWTTCTCPGYQGSRVPRCRCNYDPKKSKASPLLQIRWKRLIVDEGHVAGNARTSFSSLIKMLSVERKWIVTGTPTTNLLGLKLGEGSELRYPEADDNDNEADDQVARTWTPTDRSDLVKLSTMITQFLEIPQFATQLQFFDSYIIKPLMDPSGPRPGAIQVLMQLMSAHMVRHRIEDVEKDVLLPFMNQETVLLHLDPYALKTYNIMQAVIAVNAIDSQRVGQDYLFHAQADPTHLLNVYRALFWHVDSERLFNLHEIVENADKSIRTAEERNNSPQDIELMRKSLEHARSALNDPVWVALQGHPYIHHRVYHMPLSIVETWSRLPPNTSPAAFVDPERLGSLRAFIRKRPLSRQDNVISYGKEVAAEEKQRIAFNLAHIRPRKGKKHDKKDPKTSLKEFGAVRTTDSAEKREEMRRELLAAQARLEAFLEDDNEDNHSGNHARQAVATSPARYTVATKLLSSSPVANVRIGNSTSSKLDYILEEVRRYSPTEKFLIFSKSPLTLQYVAEGLTLIETKFLLTTQAAGVSTEQRQQMVTTFETSDLYRVFLLELKHGARGLNLVAASRVIFCEPVWQADVETQAIKRVHRIGQKRPVTVKTLAIRETSEEVMVTRREALKSSAQKQPKLTDDRRMRDFIQNPAFLQPAPDVPGTSALDLPLFGELPGRQASAAPGSTGAAAVHVEVLAGRSDAETGEPPQKRRRGVRFADAP